ncbi:uncharacterized protein [Diadema antillarum]|uniref:uncharacterized protein n=1 Tax=Diadema antillarum TaxID=105358 RepID=UPI003A83995D
MPKSRSKIMKKVMGKEPPAPPSSTRRRGRKTTKSGEEDPAAGQGGSPAASDGEIPFVGTTSRSPRDPPATPAVGELVLERERLLSQSRAASTHSTYTQAWESFQSFRSAYHFSLSANPTLEQIVQFIAYLSLNGYAAATLATYIAGLSFHLQSRGLRDVTQCFIVRRMLDGSKRGRISRDVRCPITLSILSRMLVALPHVCASSFDALLFRTAFLVAFFAFLRVGEFTVRARNHTPTLRLIDVRLHSGKAALELHLRSSKTDQGGAGCYIILPSNESKSLCPVAAASAYVAVRPRGSEAFFVRYDGAPLVRKDFNNILKRCVEFVRLPVALFSSHSFRIGAATSAATAGIPDARIKGMGRWSSNTFRRYIRIDKIFS